MVVYYRFIIVESQPRILFQHCLQIIGLECIKFIERHINVFHCYYYHHFDVYSLWWIKCGTQVYPLKKLFLKIEKIQLRTANSLLLSMTIKMKTTKGHKFNKNPFDNIYSIPQVWTVIIHNIILICTCQLISRIVDIVCNIAIRCRMLLHILFVLLFYFIHATFSDDNCLLNMILFTLYCVLY